MKKTNKIKWILVATVVFTIGFLLFNISTNVQLIDYYKTQEKELKNQIKSKNKEIEKRNLVIKNLKDSISNLDKEYVLITDSIKIIDTLYANKINNINNLSINQHDSIFSARLSKNNDN